MAKYCSWPVWVLLVVAGLPLTANGQVLWLDWTGLNSTLVKSASGQTFSFNHPELGAVNATVKSSWPQVLAKNQTTARPFIGVYNADLPANESIGFAPIQNQFNRSLTVTFDQPVTIYVANSEVTSDAEPHTWVTNGSAWSIVDDPATRNSPSLLTVSGAGTQTLGLVGLKPPPGPYDYLVAQSDAVTSFSFTSNQNAFGEEFVAIALVTEPEPQGVAVPLTDARGLSIFAVGMLALGVAAIRGGRVAA